MRAAGANMADKSPRKQGKSPKLTTKEKKAKKKAKNLAKSGGGIGVVKKTD